MAEIRNKERKRENKIKKYQKGRTGKKREGRIISNLISGIGIKK